MKYNYVGLQNLSSLSQGNLHKIRALITQLHDCFRIDYI